MYCIYCGKQLTTDMMYCPYCGRSITKPESHKNEVVDLANDSHLLAQPRSFSFYSEQQGQRSDSNVTKKRRSMKSIDQDTGTKILFAFGMLLIMSVVILKVHGVIGGGYGKQLVGTWYHEGSSQYVFVLYDNGSCDISGESAKCSWEIVNGDTLRLSNMWGESESAKIISINNDRLVVERDGVRSVFVSR